MFFRNQSALNQFKRLFIGCTLLLLPLLSWAASVDSLRLWQSPDSTRLVFDLDSATEHSLFTLDNPDRIVIDIPKGRAKSNFSAVDLTGSPISRIRTGEQSDKLRIVLDLSQAVKPSSFTLAPNEKYGDRLVIDLAHQGGAQLKPSAPPKPVTLPTGQREIVVVLDAGHGGEDPGALGPGRLKEKQVVLAITK